MSGANYPSPNTATLSIAGNNAAINNVSLATYPPEGSRVLTSQYAWATALPVSYAEDLSALVARGVESTIQGAYIDNTECCFTVALYLPGTMQQIIVPAYAWKYIPLLVGGAGYQISVHQPPFSSLSAFTPSFTSVFAPALNYTRVILVNCPTNPTDTYVVEPYAGALTSILSNGAVVKQGPGILNSVSVVVATAVEWIAVGDGRLNALPINPTANNFVIVPAGTPAGTIYDMNVRFSSGLRVNYNTGATGSISLSFS